MTSQLFPGVEFPTLPFMLKKPVMYFHMEVVRGLYSLLGVRGMEIVDLLTAPFFDVMRIQMFSNAEIARQLEAARAAAAARRSNANGTGWVGMGGDGWAEEWVEANLLEKIAAAASAAAVDGGGGGSCRPSAFRLAVAAAVGAIGTGWFSRFSPARRRPPVAAAAAAARHAPRAAWRLAPLARPLARAVAAMILVSLPWAVLSQCQCGGSACVGFQFCTSGQCCTSGDSYDSDTNTCTNFRTPAQYTCDLNGGSDYLVGNQCYHFTCFTPSYTLVQLGVGADGVPIMQCTPPRRGRPNS